jgi:hypothetical protein
VYEFARHFPPDTRRRAADLDYAPLLTVPGHKPLPRHDGMCPVGVLLHDFGYHLLPHRSPEPTRAAQLMQDAGLVEHWKDIHGSLRQFIARFDAGHIDGPGLRRALGI